jgi:C4-dicarboxylate-binding protein DctP
VLDTTVYFNSIAKKDNDDALTAIRAHSKIQVVNLSKDEKVAFKKTLFKLHKQFEPVVGKDLIESIYRETNVDPAKL